MRNKLQIQIRQRGNCSKLAGKSRGGTPFCRTLKIVFPRSRIFYKVIFHCNCSPGTVTRYMFLIQVSQGGAVLFAPPRKAVTFLTTRSVCQKDGTGISLSAARCLQFSFQVVQFPLRFQSAQPNISLSRCHRERLYPPNVIVEYPCFRVNRNI